MQREFIVAKHGTRSSNPIVVIREVTHGSCSFTQNRADAWNFAKRLAKPSPDKRRKKAMSLPIHFVGLDMMTTVVDTGD